jgi:hypothetical protein
MSYILDALTKAAQQRDRQVPVVQRLLSPAPRPRSSWHYASGRLLAALALNAVLLAAVLFWWLRPAAVTAPEPIAATPESIATPAPPVTSPRPLVKLEPLPSAEMKVEKPAPSRLEPSALPCRRPLRRPSRSRRHVRAPGHRRSRPRRRQLRPATAGVPERRRSDSRR